MNRQVPEEKLIQFKRAVAYLNRYGLTMDDYDRIYKFQDGKCAICGRRQEKLDIDHDHERLVVRGLLCGPCNIKMATVDKKIGNSKIPNWWFKMAEGYPFMKPIPIKKDPSAYRKLKRKYGIGGY